MAIGYARASGRPGVVVAIPGPGLAYAFAGLVEARADSVPLVCIVPAAPPENGAVSLPGSDAVAAGCAVAAKARIRVSTLDQLFADVQRAFDLASSGEPGPVLLEIPADMLRARGVPGGERWAPPVVLGPPDASIEEMVELLAASRRVALLLGCGATARPDEIRRLAEALHSPVLTTTSARGVLAEDHPLSLCRDLGLAPVDRVNALLDEADLVLALGWRGSWNGTGGHALRIAPGKLVRVDTSAEALANVPCARLTLQADAAAVVSELMKRSARLAEGGAGWKEDTLASLRRELQSGLESGGAEPVLAGGDPAAFFGALRRVLPPDACLVTDSGLHQMLVRRHFQVLCSRGLIVPCDFQAMGFGLPAAIGASLAAPQRPVVALIGDGGLLMTAMEVLTAVELRLPLKILVFCDARLGLIHRQQVERFGHAHGTEIPSLDLAGLARAMGAGYARVDGAAVEESLRNALCSPGVTRVEVPVTDSAHQRAVHVKALVRSAAGPAVRSLVGSLVSRLRGRGGNA
jgi:acetolactate synthase-1/2/3 large subunit